MASSKRRVLVMRVFWESSLNGSTSSLAREETNLFRFTSWCSPKTLHPTFYSLRSYYICTISFGVLLDKWCVGGILQVHRRWLYMNHTKAMLTDILLHLRKRAERGDPVWRELAGRGPVGRLLRPGGIRRRVSVFPGPPNGPGVGCVGPAGRGRGGNPLPCPGAFLLVTSTDIRSPSCQRGEMGG